MGEKLVTPVIIFTVSLSSALASVSEGPSMSISIQLSVALWIHLDPQLHF